MHLKAIRSSYGDFGNIRRGMILRDVPKDLGEKLIARGAYVEATAADLKAASDQAFAPAAKAKRDPLDHDGNGRKGGSLPKGARQSKANASDDLRDDGPTVAEYVAAGYLASNYPPEGYAARSTPEEIAAAVAAEKAAAEEKAKSDAEAASKTAEEEAAAKAKADAEK